MGSNSSKDKKNTEDQANDVPIWPPMGSHSALKGKVLNICYTFSYHGNDTDDTKDDIDGTDKDFPE